MGEHRIFCEWESGAWINSLAPDFHQELNKLIAQHGPPSKVEVRSEKDWLHPSDPGVRVIG
jgi:hypothetical protein